MTITQEALDAAAKALASLDRTDDWTGRGDFDSLDDWEQDCAREAVRAALEAALPHIREQIAQEIEAERSTNNFRNVVLERAARIVRDEQ